MELYKTAREEAMTWWNGLGDYEKIKICSNDKKLIGQPRNHKTLTGSEIQSIYYKLKFKNNETD